MSALLPLVLLACAPSDPSAEARGPLSTASTDSGASTSDSGSEGTRPTVDTGTPSTPPTTGGLTSERCEAMAFRPDGQFTFYETNPVLHDPADHRGPYPTRSPSSIGLSDALLQQATAELGTWGFVDSFIVFVDGAMVWEHYADGVAPEDSHNIHSASKSVLALATGIAFEQGHLAPDDTLEHWLPEYTEGLEQEKRDITVRQLLEMTGGFRWQEDHTEQVIEKEEDWVQAILELPLHAPPGTWFNYNTGHTHLLSAVLQRATGQSTCDFVHESVFDPLGIQAEHWGRDPQGVFSGGYNVYLTPRELARFGVLVEQQGVWEGQQLVSAAYVADMLATHQHEPPYGYGLLWWTRELRGHPVQIAWGYGGQFIYRVPDLGLMVVITTDTHDHDPWFFDAEYIVAGALIPALE